jgi:hypothetical protein
MTMNISFSVVALAVVGRRRTAAAARPFASANGLCSPSQRRTNVPRFQSERTALPPADVTLGCAQPGSRRMSTSCAGRAQA